MLKRRMQIRLRKLLVAALILGAAGLSFWLAPRLWTWYSPFVGVIALCGGLLMLLPLLPVLVFRWYNPPASAFMLQTTARLKRLQPAPPERAYRWVNLSQISPQMCLAVIVAEDFTFPIHPGFIWHSIVAAFRANRGVENSDDWRGGSTITQQLVKNLFLWPARSYVRKAIELHWTLFVELLWPKWRILEVYLNIVQLGENLFGVEAASRAFFHKPASDLSPQECTLLATALPNPIFYPVAKPSPRMRFRQAMILKGMKTISPEYMDFIRSIGLYREGPISDSVEEHDQA